MGKILAEQLHLPFIDVDAEITKKEGMSIDEIFERKGETFFRSLEKNYIEELVKRDSPGVIALGGGAVTIKQVRDLIKKKMFSG